MNQLKPIDGYQYNTGIAYIAIPSDLDRTEYIKDCFKNFHVSIKAEDGGFYNRVPIPPEVLNFIEFPKEAKDVGSCVFYAVGEQLQAKFIVGRFEDRANIGDGREGLFQFKKKAEDSFVQIAGSAKEGGISVVVNAGALRRGWFHLYVGDKNKTAEALIDIAGNLNVRSTQTTSLTQKELNLASEDESGTATINQTSTQTNFKNSKFVFNEGEEPLILGNQLRDFLRNFIGEVAKITVNGSPAANALEIAGYIQQVDDLLSQEVYIKQ